jgi:spore coat polysaccharide biosynthesis predicted glycosyltransferase SpsG
VKKKFIFITEARAKRNVSFGHFFRCFEISKILNKLGYKTYFYNINYRDVELFPQLKKSFQITNLKKFLDFNKINNFNIIIDLFKPNLKLIRVFKNCNKLIIFNDSNKLKPINNVKILNFEKYKSIKFFRILGHKKFKIDNKNHVSINTGGSDLKKIHEKILEKIIKENLNEATKFFFYIGPGIKRKNLYKKKIKNIFFINDNILFTKKALCSKFIITSGGISMYENLYFRKKVLAIPTSFTEKNNIKYLKNKKFLLNFNFKKSFKENFYLISKLKLKKIISLNKIMKDFQNIFLDSI